MVNHAKSDVLKRQIARKEKDDLMTRAVALFHAKQVDSDTGKPMSMRRLCQLVSDHHFAKTKKRIPVDHSTLARLVKGGITRTESNGTKAWLTKEEADIIVNFAIVIARRGFPLSPKRLREHAERILTAHLGNKFPTTGLGKNWATRFITKHNDKLGMYWSKCDRRKPRWTKPKAPRVEKGVPRPKVADFEEESEGDEEVEVDEDPGHESEDVDGMDNSDSGDSD